MHALEQLSLVIIYAGMIQGFFVAFLLNSRSVRRSRANTFLSILLVTLSFSIVHTIFAGPLFHHLSVSVHSFGDPTFLLIAPLVWFYTAELTGKQIKLNISLWLHFTPFLAIAVLSLVLGAIDATEVFAFFKAHHRVMVVIFWIMIVAQFSTYQVFIHKRWRRSTAMLTAEVSNPEDVNIAWIRYFMVVFLLVNIFLLLGLFVVIHHNNRSWLWKANALIFSISVFALSYKGILQREIFDTIRPIEPVPEPVISTTAEVVKDDVLIRQVITFMEARKPYLDPELTLSTLAKELNISRSQLSQVINDGIGDNFYNFVNQYRVDEVKRLMVDPQFSHFNMLGLALEAGFKSKSTFNLIFKRFTGLTPTEYRKNISR